MDIQAENKKEFGIPKSAMAIFSVASVLFSAHMPAADLQRAIRKIPTLSRLDGPASSVLFWPCFF